MVRVARMVMVVRVVRVIRVVRVGGWMISLVRMLKLVK